MRTSRENKFVQHSLTTQVRRTKPRWNSLRATVRLVMWSRHSKKKQHFCLNCLFCAFSVLCCFVCRVAASAGGRLNKHSKPQIPPSAPRVPVKWFLMRAHSFGIRPFTIPLRCRRRSRGCTTSTKPHPAGSNRSTE